MYYLLKVKVLYSNKQTLIIIIIKEFQQLPSNSRLHFETESEIKDLRV